MHVIAGELHNMKRPRRKPLLTFFVHPMGASTNIHRTQRRAAQWLFETLDDPEPVMAVDVRQQKDTIVTTVCDRWLPEINKAIHRLYGPGYWFNGFNRLGEPQIKRRRT